MQLLVNATTMILFATISIMNLGFGDITFTEHVVAQNYNNPWSAFAIDVDNDNDIDVVGSGRLAHNISWWENTGNFTFQQHTISTTSYYAMVVHALDIDIDGDVDILCASQNNGVELWENQGNQNFFRHFIAVWPYASFLSVADVDNDNDVDVLVCCCEGGINRMGWLENQGGLSFNEHIVTDNWDHANSVCGADLDSDGDVDLIGTASYAGEVAWFENDGSQNFTKHVILSTATRPSSAYADDVDSDGDLDVLATICVLDIIAWFENDGSQVFTQHTIGTAFYRPHAVRTADFDNDDDLDVFGSAITGSEIAWWENLGGTPVQWTKHVIASSFSGATGIQVVDMDYDEDVDVLGAAQFGNSIKWWENDLIPGISEYENSARLGLSLNAVPNPAVSSVHLCFTIDHAADVLLEILDASGRCAASPVRGHFPAGTHDTTFDAAKYPCGVYFARLSACGSQIVKEFALLK